MRGRKLTLLPRTRSMTDNDPVNIETKMLHRPGRQRCVRPATPVLEGPRVTEPLFGAPWGRSVGATVNGSSGEFFIRGVFAGEGQNPTIVPGVNIARLRIRIYNEHRRPEWGGPSEADAGRAASLYQARNVVSAPQVGSERAMPYAGQRIVVQPAEDQGYIQGRHSNAAARYLLPRVGAGLGIHRQRGTESAFPTARMGTFARPFRKLVKFCNFNVDKRYTDLVTPGSGPRSPPRM